MIITLQMLIGMGDVTSHWFWRKMFGGNWLLTWPFWKNGVLWSLSSLQLNLDSSDPSRACNPTPTSGLEMKYFGPPLPPPFFIFYLVWDWLFSQSLLSFCMKLFIVWGHEGAFLPQSSPCLPFPQSIPVQRYTVYRSNVHSQLPTPTKFVSSPTFEILMLLFGPGE